MQGDTQKLIILEAVEAVLRSWGLVIAGGCLGLSVALVALHYMPRVYQAHATIFANAEKLPPEFVRATVSDELDVRLGTLRDAVLKRENLEQVALQAYPAASAGELRVAFRESIPARVGLHYDRRTQKIDISFLDTNPNRAAAASNALAHFLIQENAKFRTGRAAEAVEFIRSELTGVEAELQRQQNAIAVFRREHPYTGLDNRARNEQIARDQETKLEAKEKEIAAAKTRLQTIEAQAEQAGLDTQFSGPGESSPEPLPRGGSAALAQAKAELADLLLRYSENHPDVRAKRREIARLESKSAAPPTPKAPESDATSSPQPETTPQIDIYAAQARASQLEINRLEGEKAAIEKTLNRARTYLQRGPDADQELADMDAKLEVLQRKYADLQTKLETAETAQRAEETKLGNPFELIASAAPPGVPVKPKPLPTLAAGGIVGVGLFLLPILIPVVLRPLITSQARLEALSDLPVLATIPLIPGPETHRVRRKAILKNVGISIASVAMLAFVLSLKILDVL